MISREEVKVLENEANVLACLILMPKVFFEADMKGEMDLGDDDSMKVLAKKYQVPLNALAFRIYLYHNKHI